MNNESKLREALIEIQEMFHGEADIDSHGNPNRAMKIDGIVERAIATTPIEDGNRNEELAYKLAKSLPFTFNVDKSCPITQSIKELLDAKDSAYEKVVREAGERLRAEVENHEFTFKQLSSLQSKAKGLEGALEKVKPFLPDSERKIAQEALKCYREEKLNGRMDLS